MSDDIGDWTNGLGLVSVASETLVVVLASLAVPDAGVGSPRARRSLVPAVLLAGGVIAATSYGLGVALA